MPLTSLHVSVVDIDVMIAFIINKHRLLSISRLQAAIYTKCCKNIKLQSFCFALETYYLNVYLNIPYL